MAVITVSTGAGISAESGVATFRDKDGLWEGHKVEDVAHWKAYQKNPQLVWTFYRNRWLQRQEVTFNAAHEAIVDLENWAVANGHEFLLITQNVDRLHHAAGSKVIVELHGNLHNVKCGVCDFITDDQSYWQHEEVPDCPLCGSKLRSDIVWFGESMPVKEIHTAMDYAEKADVMLVVGTSGQVYPAAQLPGMVARRGGKVFESNKELAFTQLMSDFYDGYYPFKGNATVTVPLAVAVIKKTVQQVTVLQRDRLLYP